MPDYHIYMFEDLEILGIILSIVFSQKLDWIHAFGTC